MKHKKQHWIPQSYLQDWCDPDIPPGQNEYTWIFARDGGNPKKKNPKNIFFEPDMYTIHLKDGTRVLDIEHGLAGLENAFANVRKNVISYKKQPNSNDRIIILAFIAATFSRTRIQKEHLSKQWGHALELMEAMKKEMENATPEHRKAMATVSSLSSDGPKLSMDEVKKLAEKPLQETLISSIVTQIELFQPMNLRFLCTKTDPGFITSDAPCVWYDRDAYKRPPIYRSPGLIYPTIEITLPISPWQMAYLTWSPPLNTYIDVPGNIVDEFNRRTRFFANEYFVVRRNYIKEIWLDPGKPPQ